MYMINDYYKTYYKIINVRERNMSTFYTNKMTDYFINAFV